jgi:hypothetical protein
MMCPRWDFVDTIRSVHGIDPERYLQHVLERIADHPINRIDELLPWNVNLPKAHTPKPTPDGNAEHADASDS